MENSGHTRWPKKRSDFIKSLATIMVARLITTHIPGTILFSIARLSILNSQNHTSLGSVGKFRKISANIVQKNHQNPRKFGSTNI